MSEQLLDAISAIRNGNSREAQQLLTDLLQEDPSNEQAWFLLSNIVESDDLRTAYLSKTLALNPHHEKARQQLARLKVTAVATPEPEILPDDLFTDDDVHDAMLAALTDDSEPFVDEEPADDMEALPDWMNEIDEEPEATLTPTKEKVTPTAKTAAEPAPKDLSYADRDKQLARYNQMLLVVGLFLVIAIIFLLVNL